MPIRQTSSWRLGATSLDTCGSACDHPIPQAFPAKSPLAALGNEPLRTDDFTAVASATGRCSQRFVRISVKKIMIFHFFRYLRENSHLEVNINFRSDVGPKLGPFFLENSTSIGSTTNRERHRIFDLLQDKIQNHVGLILGANLWPC